MRIVFFDTETTGGGPEDRLVALAAKERPVSCEATQGKRHESEAGVIVNALYKPPVPLSIESMAVHHITEKRVAGKPAFADAPEYAQVKALFEHPDTLAVAHNAAFDIEMLAREGIAIARPVCTLKVARALDPDERIPSYALQYLRHYFGLELDAPAHDAWSDVLVLEAVFEQLLMKLVAKTGSEKAALARMREITAMPTLFVSFTFGKHRGKTIAAVAAEAPDYLEWLLREKRKEPLGEADWIYTLEYHLKAVRGA